MQWVSAGMIRLVGRGVNPADLAFLAASAVTERPALVDRHLGVHDLSAGTLGALDPQDAGESRGRVDHLEERKLGRPHCPHKVVATDRMGQPPRYHKAPANRGFWLKAGLLSTRTVLGVLQQRTRTDSPLPGLPPRL